MCYSAQIRADYKRYVREWGADARRDNLEGFWRDLFGAKHCVMIANAFFENVSKHRMEGRELAPGEKEENVILEFRPQPTQEMIVACLWSHWQEGDESLLSFAAVTDDPRKKSRQRDTIAASFRSSLKTSTLG